MAERWRDIRASQARRVKRGKRATRDNNGGVEAFETTSQRSVRKLRQPAQNWVGCSICLNQKGIRVKAEVIVRGLSVCAEHVALASRPDFDISQLHAERNPL